MTLLTFAPLVLALINKKGPGFSKILISIGLIKRSPGQVKKFGEQAKHPIVRTHPTNGQKSIYLNPIRVEKIDGLSRQDSDAVLDGLYEHLFQSPFQYRHKWRVGDFLIWDNRGGLHQANDDYDWRKEQRELYRIMVKGERPI